MIRLLTKQLKRHRSGLTQAVALFFGATILIATIGRTKATALRLTPPPAAAGDGGLFSFSGDDWLVNLMLAAVAFAGTTSLLFVCAKRSRGNSDRITRATKSPPPPSNQTAKVWFEAGEMQASDNDNAAKARGQIRTILSEDQIRQIKAEGPDAAAFAVTSKRACQVAIGLHTITLDSLVRQHAVVKARADAQDASSVAEDEANAARAARLGDEIMACQSKLEAAKARYLRDNLAGVSVPVTPIPPVDTSADGWQARAAAELMDMQLQVGIEVTAAAAEGGGTAAAAAVSKFNARSGELFAAIAPSVMATTDQYDQAQAAALATAEDRAAMGLIMALAGTTQSQKVLQPAAAVGQSDTVAGTIEALLDAAAREGPEIHAAVATLLAGFKYRRGPNKQAARSFDKVLQKYLAMGGARALTDVVRGAVICGSYAEMHLALKAVYGSANFEVLRGKFSVDPEASAADAGGYRDVQLLVRQAGGGGHVFELQFVLSSMYEIKGVEGHKIYRAARAVGAYEPASFEHRGALTEDVVQRAGAGLLRTVAVASKGADTDAALLARLWAALALPTCRVRSLGLHGLKLGAKGLRKLGAKGAEGLAAVLGAGQLQLTDLDLGDNQLGPEFGKIVAGVIQASTSLRTVNLNNNNLGPEGGKAIGEALKVNTSITNINLWFNKLGPEGGKAIGEALKVNTSITNINLENNELGAEGGKAIGEALKVNKSITNINLTGNNLGSEGGTAIGGALKVNRSITSIDLYANNLGPAGGKAIGEALKVNTSITNINLGRNDLGPEAGKAIGKALKINTSITDINLRANDLDAATKTAIKAAWGDRGGNLSL